MRRSLFGLLTVTLLATACGGGDGTDTSAPAAQSPDTAQTETTEPETSPETTPPTTSPETTETTSSGAAPADDYGYDYGGSDDARDKEDSGEEDSGEESEEVAAGGIATADSELGEILVGPDGMTLYVFLPDEQGESTCYDSCASTWPPVEGDVGADAGLDEAMLGTAERTDGTTQATYNGWPLYYYAGDVETGDVTGQGVGGNWFVIDASGEVVEG